MTMIDPDARGDIKHRIEQVYRELEEHPLFNLLMETRNRITMIGTKGYKKEEDGELEPVVEDWVKPVLEEITDVQDYIRQEIAKKYDVPWGSPSKKKN